MTGKRRGGGAAAPPSGRDTATERNLAGSCPVSSAGTGTNSSQQAAVIPGGEQPPGHSLLKCTSDDYNSKKEGALFEMAEAEQVLLVRMVAESKARVVRGPEKEDLMAVFNTAAGGKPPCCAPPLVALPQCNSSISPGRPSN